MKTSSKLFAYSAAALSYLSTNEADAQVNYTNNPDIEWSGPGIEIYTDISIDLNSDDINDLNFLFIPKRLEHVSFNSTYGSMVFLQAIGDNDVEVAANSSGNFFMAMDYLATNLYDLYKFNSGNIINEDLNWRNSGNIFASVFYVTSTGILFDEEVGLWGDNIIDNKYCAFRIPATEYGYHYGWMRFSTANIPYSDEALMHYEITIHDYAFNTEINGGIYAGQLSGTDHIYEITDNNITLAPNPVHDNLNIIFDNSGFSEIEIVNISGERIRHIPIYRQEKYSINISDFADGVYILKAIGDGIVTTTKFTKTSK